MPKYAPETKTLILFVAIIVKVYSTFPIQDWATLHCFLFACFCVLC